MLNCEPVAVVDSFNRRPTGASAELLVIAQGKGPVYVVGPLQLDPQAVDFY